jgi:hypothetical protein
MQHISVVWGSQVALFLEPLVGPVYPYVLIAVTICNENRVYYNRGVYEVKCSQNYYLYFSMSK